MLRCFFRVISFWRIEPVWIVQNKQWASSFYFFAFSLPFPFFPIFCVYWLIALSILPPFPLLISCFYFPSSTSWAKSPTSFRLRPQRCPLSFPFSFTSPSSSDNVPPGSLHASARSLAQAVAEIILGVGAPSARGLNPTMGDCEFWQSCNGSRHESIGLCKQRRTSLLC